MAGTGGYRTGAGRKKGVPNKQTKAVKDAVKKAFDELGGYEWLVKVAKEDPKTFIPLLQRLVPNQQNTTIEGGENPVKIQSMSDEQLLEIINGK